METPLKYLSKVKKKKQEQKKNYLKEEEEEEGEMIGIFWLVP